MRLHEMFQMCVIILLTVIIPSLVLKEVTDGFKTVKSQKDWMLVLFYVVGIYFYATGNGVHEVASFYFNQYCDTQKITGVLCNSLFFNDYYTGNILYFIGGILMVLSTLLLELKRPNTMFKKKDFWILVVNAVVYGLAIFAYAAFDVVLVGIVYSTIMAIISFLLFLSIRRKYLQYPVITYTTIIYVVGTVAAVIVRFIK